MTATLPTEFADLEPFADWALESEAERYAKRLGQLHGRAPGVLRRRLPRLEAATAYLDALAARRRSPATRPHLLWLCYSLVNASFPVEVWRQARVPDSGAATMDQVVEPAV